MAELKYDIVERLGVLSEDAKGWKKRTEPGVLERKRP